MYRCVTGGGIECFRLRLLAQTADNKYSLNRPRAGLYKEDLFQRRTCTQRNFQPDPQNPITAINRKRFRQQYVCLNCCVYMRLEVSELDLCPLYSRFAQLEESSPQFLFIANSVAQSFIEKLLTSCSCNCLDFHRNLQALKHKGQYQT